MENKYFTPSIEDIRVGYECEYLFGGEQGIWTNGFGLTSTGFPELWEIKANPKILRTPYLTKEQIEAEGWEITYRELKEPPYKLDWINAKKGDFTLWINLAMTNSMHLGIDKTDGVAGILFRGQCKDINTFRYICKLLKIN